MQTSVVTILAFAFVLGVLIFVHELGHFLAAKRVGIRVLKFQLGFNPTILSVRRGDTEYSIGLLPLGGYVKMAGDSPDGEVTGRPDEFLSKTKWERFQVLIMGPVMNLLLAVIVLGVRAAPGRRRAGLPGSASSGRHRHARIARRPGRHSAGRPDSLGGRQQRRYVGAAVHRDRNASQPGSVDRASARRP